MTERFISPQPGTFFNMPACTDIDELSADVAFLGIPYEYGKSLENPSGQKFAPKAIRDQKRRYFYNEYRTDVEENQTRAEDKYAVGWFNIDTGIEELKGVTMADCGNVRIVPSEGDKSFDRITLVVRKVLDRGAFPVLIGGDHTIPFPVVRAFDRYNPLDIVHFDGHLDYSYEWDGSRINGATSIRRCSELPFVRNITHVGLAYWHDMEAYYAALKRGNKIITADRFRKIGVSEVIKSIPQGKNIYVTIDIDVLNPATAPATSVPNPGGLNFLELRDALIELPTRGKVVGFDLVEVCPPIDCCNNLTSWTAAELILYFLGAIFPSKK